MSNIERFRRTKEHKNEKKCFLTEKYVRYVLVLKNISNKLKIEIDLVIYFQKSNNASLHTYISVLYVFVQNNVDCIKVCWTKYPGVIKFNTVPVPYQVSYFHRTSKHRNCHCWKG